MAAKKRRRRGPAVAKSEASAASASDQIETLDDVLAEIEACTGRMVRADRARNELVGRARVLGASWNQIARAADMTPQGAHSKWRYGS